MHPYQGSFDEEPVFYRYVVNETRKEYVARMDGQYLCTVEGKDILEDVTPAILGDTNRLDYRGQEVLEGPWGAMLLRPPTTDRALILPT